MTRKYKKRIYKRKCTRKLKGGSPPKPRWKEKAAEKAAKMRAEASMLQADVKRILDNAKEEECICYEGRNSACGSCNDKDEAEERDARASELMAAASALEADALEADAPKASTSPPATPPLPPRRDDNTLPERGAVEMKLSIGWEEEAAREAAAPSEARRVTWMPDNTVTNCTICNKGFGRGNSRHHCRYCGQIICDKCRRGERIFLGANKGWEHPELKLPLDQWVSSTRGHRMKHFENELEWQTAKEGLALKEKSVCKTCYKVAPAEIIGRLKVKLAQFQGQVDALVQPASQSFSAPKTVKVAKEKGERRVHALESAIRQLEAVKGGQALPTNL